MGPEKPRNVYGNRDNGFIQLTWATVYPQLATEGARQSEVNQEVEVPRTESGAVDFTTIDQKFWTQGMVARAEDNDRLNGVTFDGYTYATDSAVVDVQPGTFPELTVESYQLSDAERDLTMPGYINPRFTQAEERGDA